MLRSASQATEHDPDNIGSRSSNEVSEFQMTYPKRGSTPRKPAAIDRDADIRIFEAIDDVLALRHEPKWKPSKQEFDFFGSMVRAQRIFGGSKGESSNHGRFLP